MTRIWFEVEARELKSQKDLCESDDHYIGKFYLAKVRGRML